MSKIHSRIDKSNENLDNGALEEIFETARDEKIEYLDLSKNQFTEIEFLFALPDLKVLDLSYNNAEISKITIPEGFDNLKYLWIYQSNLKEIEIKGAMPKLDTLHLAENKLESIELEEGFGELVTLYLENNQLKEFPEDLLDDLPKLEFLSLRRNPLSDSMILGYVDNGQNCLPFMEEYMEKKASQKATFDNESKVLLIGNGNVGKTCFVERLVRDQFVKEWNSTHAINIETYQKDDFPYKLNVWDFGGQDIYHATHRLFMQSHATYLLFWDWETAQKPYSEIEEKGVIRKYENQPLNYWLAYADILGHNSPVVVVQTKMGAHKKKTAPNQDKLLDRYGEIIKSFEHIESSEKNWEKNGYEELLDKVRICVRKQKKSAKIMKSAIELRDKIREIQRENKAKKTLSLEEYDELAVPFKIGTAEEIINPRSILENWLVKTGVVYFKQGLFNDYIILDQAWAIKAIYTLFDRDGCYHELRKNENGEFRGSDLLRFWEEYKQKDPEWEYYGRDEQELFVSFMLSCELCFETTKEDRHEVRFEDRTFVAPQLLNENKNKNVTNYWEDRPSWYVKFSYEHLHYGIIQSFIIRTQHLADVQDIWQKGIHLKDVATKEYAMIEAFKNRDRNDEIKVRITKQSKSLLDKIRNLIEELQDSPPEEYISLDDQHYVSIKKLQNNPDVNPIEASNTGEYVDAEELRQFYMRDTNDRFETKKEKTSKKGEKALKPEKMKAFISYSHKDKRYFKAFTDNLKDQCDWEIWDDRNIEIGEKWREQIKEQVESCDFGILLISPGFLSSDFIKENEFGEFLKIAKTNPNFRFIPVLLRDCDFTRWEDLAEIQLFVAHGDDYGIRKKEGKQIAFAELCKFDEDGLIPNSHMDTFLKDLVEVVQRNKK